jgi:DNA-binding MarR family transcriptional regulator
VAGPETKHALGLWRAALVETIRRKGPDLSTRQMAILLTAYLVEGPHSVRGLAGDLSISKPAVSRALDRLGDLGFIRRVRDISDRRNVFVERTVAGSVFLSEFADVIAAASEKPR